MTCFKRILTAWSALAIISCPTAVNALDSDSEKAQTTIDSLLGKTDPNRTVFKEGSKGVSIIHVNSGMNCVVGAKEFQLNKLTIFPNAPTGDDVSCDYITPSGITNVFVMRANGRDAASAAFEIFKAIKTVNPRAEVTKGPLTARYPGLSDPIAASFTTGEKNILSSVWVAETGGWLVEVRATYPTSDRHDREFLAAMAMINARVSIMEARR